ncbi:hypothetical protein E1A91_D11G244100v1 [Gossypium mustelinum]|uniref:Secreted protein n=1 Tax=Gossypium mustelinum TaxID=34275 RepID=A0A5D2SWN1_GOSMU|nr:hypothetical protein E1A91_D11G244100v1 [Gossypium mustelinum]
MEWKFSLLLTIILADLTLKAKIKSKQINKPTLLQIYRQLQVSRQQILKENDRQSVNIKRCKIFFEGFFRDFEHLGKCCYR